MVVHIRSRISILVLVLTCLWACDDRSRGQDIVVLNFDGAVDMEIDASVPVDQGRSELLGDAVLSTSGACAPPTGGPFVHGRAYIDVNRSDRSTYTGGPDESDEPFEPELNLVAAETGAVNVETCSDGTYKIGPLTAGTYLVQHELESARRCTTSNCPGRFSRKIAAGETPVMLTFGDSIAVIGDRPLFPDRVKTLFSGLTDIDSRNVAVGGSTSIDWLPDGPYFERRLGGELAEADLIIVTIGGNDLLRYVSRIGIPNDIPAALEGARAVVLQVIDNVTQILDAIREVNPDADIAYCLYADYSQATEDLVWGLIGSILGPDAVGEVLRLAREQFPTDDPNIVLVDLFGAAQGLPLHDYLYDELHFNDLGHTLYAEEVFETLGGVLLGPNPLGDTGKTPLGLRRNYGVAPSEQ